MRTALLYLCIALTLGCAARRGPTTEQWREAAYKWRQAVYDLYDMMYSSAGFTIWDCRYDHPRYFVGGPYLDSLGVRLHEQRHIQQAVGVGCQVWQIVTADSASLEILQEDADRYARRVP